MRACLLLVVLWLSLSAKNFAAESLLPELGKSPVTIVCLGDSVTGVYYHTGGWQAYPEMLEIALEQVHPNAEIKVINAGISGHSTQNGLDRLDKDVLQHKPQLVSISFGLNDAVRHPVDQFQKNLSELVDRCQKAGARVVLCTPNMVLESGGRPIAKLNLYNEVIRAVAKEKKAAVCDQFVAGLAQQKKDPLAWRLTLSDAIHPNMAGHKLMAEELCFAISGKRTSVADVLPPRPALKKTWSKLKAGQSAKVLAMPPYDKFVEEALKAQFKDAKIEVTPWVVDGKSLAEIEQFAKASVRTIKPDLVVLAIPRSAAAPSQEAFVNSYTWIMNWSLSFGYQEWDCVVVHPSVSEPGSKHAADELVRKLVKAQHLHLIDRKGNDRASAMDKLSSFLSDDLKSTETRADRGAAEGAGDLLAVAESEKRPIVAAADPKPAKDKPAKDEPIDLERGLILRLPLTNDAKDISKPLREVVNHGVTFVNDTTRSDKRAAQFNGRGAHLEIPAKVAPRVGKKDFSVSMWVNSARETPDLPGDLISQYNPKTRRGWQLSLKSNVGVTFTTANQRHLQFSIDRDLTSEWIDCGKPGNALLAFALVVHEGALYAGTCEPGEHESGRVYRYENGQKWVDCGAPDKSNAVTAMIVHGGKLYAGTGKYRVAGSALKESENTTLGGRVFRYEGEQRWSDCGQLPNAEAVGGMIEFRGRLYASSLYKPAGFFRYERDKTWTDCGVPDGKRVEALGIFDGYLYATSYDGGRVYRFDGERWSDCGLLGNNTQTYAFAVYQGRLYVGTWPSGRVFRFEDVNRWTDVGRLGQELEVMGMLVHNGRLLAGTLPLAQVYRFDGDGEWQLLKQLDSTADVKYRRAWTMAEHRGQLFCSTLPSGKVFAMEAGKTAAFEREFPEGWHHVAAVKSSGSLRLFIDGRHVADSSTFEVNDYDIDADAPLLIGRGMTDGFSGRMSDMRLYDRAITEKEIEALSK